MSGFTLLSSCNKDKRVKLNYGDDIAHISSTITDLVPQTASIRVQMS